MPQKRHHSIENMITMLIMNELVELTTLVDIHNAICKIFGD